MTEEPTAPTANAVRPEGATPREALATVLSQVRHAVGGDRSELLYQALARAIAAIDPLKGAPISLLDYGCGTMGFSSRLAREGVVTQFTGMDVYAPPADAADLLWQHYRQLPAAGISAVSGRFDLAIVTDVLHHVAPAERSTILQHLTRIARFVLVKDHFEYGFFSRHLLRLADWYGNYAYGVNVPDRYFDTASWQALLQEAGVVELQQQREVQVHRGLFNLLLPPRHHFLSLLTARS